jgi:glycosyltransferase involved in cell wall biosynthesis
MKIAIHCNQFDGRGSGKGPFDYGVCLQEHVNADIIFVTTKQSANEGIEKINKRFNVVVYDTKPIHHQNFNEQLITKNTLEDIVSHEKIDFFHFIKSGENDNITPINCKTGVHCVFKMNEPHGSVYAGISEYLAKKFNKPEYVPQPIRYISPTCNFREKYNIPKDAFVIGRHGGPGHFNIKFVQDVIIDILNHRKDIYFLFLSTNPFVTHERVIHIPWVKDEQDVFNFIDACDVMLHAREDGETFGLSVAEFSVSNKPVITWSGIWDGCPHQRYDKCHLDLLEDRVVVYNNYKDLLDILFSIDKTFIKEYNWDKYSNRFSPKKVMEQYIATFLK